MKIMNLFIVSLITMIVSFEAQSQDLTLVKSKIKRVGKNFKLIATVKNKDNKDYFVTSNYITVISKETVFSNCYTDTFDFSLGSDGVKKERNQKGINDAGTALVSSVKPGKKIKYVFNFNMKCERAIYFIVRYGSAGNFYKSIISLDKKKNLKPEILTIKLSSFSE